VKGDKTRAFEASKLATELSVAPLADEVSEFIQAIAIGASIRPSVRLSRMSSGGLPYGYHGEARDIHSKCPIADDSGFEGREAVTELNGSYCFIA
jgi:hypothetical protein